MCVCARAVRYSEGDSEDSDAMSLRKRNQKGRWGWGMGDWSTGLANISVADNAQAAKVWSQRYLVRIPGFLASGGAWAWGQAK